MKPNILGAVEREHFHKNGTKRSQTQYNTLTSTTETKRRKSRKSLPIEHFSEYTASLDKSIRFLPQNRTYASIENELIDIVQIASLISEKNPSCWGVIAKEDLEGPMELGVYLGDKNKICTDEDALEDNDFNYTFDLGNGTEINGKKTRGWPAVVNCSITPNVIAFKNGHTIIFKIPAGVTIRKGHQLLVDYGEKYTFENKVYLNSTDTNEESLDKLNKNLYLGSIQNPPGHRPTLQLDAVLLKQIGMDDYTQYYVPDLEKLNLDTINLPILAADQTQQQPLPQSQQENLTLLHLASWEGDMAKIRTLVKKGAHVNQLTRKCGYTPLHFVVLSSSDRYTLENKIDAIRYLEATGASLRLKDDYGNCILHCAIETKQAGLLQTIIELDETVLAECNDESQDCLLLAISTGSKDILDRIGSKMNARLLSKYSKEEEFKDLAKTLEELYEKLPTTEFHVLKQKIISIFEKQNDVQTKLAPLFAEHFSVKRVQPEHNAVHETNNEASTFQNADSRNKKRSYSTFISTEFGFWPPEGQPIDKQHDRPHTCSIM